MLKQRLRRLVVVLSQLSALAAIWQLGASEYWLLADAGVITDNYAAVSWKEDHPSSTNGRAYWSRDGRLFIDIPRAKYPERYVIDLVERRLYRPALRIYYVLPLP